MKNILKISLKEMLNNDINSIILSYFYNTSLF